jgi:citronellol/citronellal dehydrogenase
MVVTGGGSGIGRCTAHELASLGATVALVGRKAEKLSHVETEIVEDGGRATIHACDIREEEAVKAAVGGVLKAHERLAGTTRCRGNGPARARAQTVARRPHRRACQQRRRAVPGATRGHHPEGLGDGGAHHLTGGFLMARECCMQRMRNNGGAIVNIVADM